MERHNFSAKDSRGIGDTRKLTPDTQNRCGQSRPLVLTSEGGNIFGMLLSSTSIDIETGLIPEGDS